MIPVLQVIGALLVYAVLVGYLCFRLYLSESFEQGRHLRHLDRQTMETRWP